MKPPGRAFDAHDNGMMYHSVDNGGGDDRISEIISQFLKIYIRGYHRRFFTVATVDYFVEEAGVSWILLFKAVKADFVYEQQVRDEITL